MENVFPAKKKPFYHHIHRHILRSNFSHTSDRGYPWEIPLGALGPESDRAFTQGRFMEMVDLTHLVDLRQKKYILV